MKFSHIIKNVVAIIVFALLPLSASAKCGNVDYSWGADALEGMHDYVVTMMLYVLYLTYAVAAAGYKPALQLGRETAICRTDRNKH